MKRFLLSLLCFTFVMLSAFTASAAPNFWHHPDYNLSKATNIIITDFQNTSESSNNFVSKQNIKETVISAVYAAAARENLLVTEDYNARTYSEPVLQTKSKKIPSELELQITVNKLGYTKRVVAAHYEEKTEYIKIKEDTKNNRDIDIPVQHKVYVPEVTYYTAYLEINYNVYDAKTHTLVFNSRDYRSRGDTFDTSGMLERSTKDFIKNIKKSK